MNKANGGDGILLSYLISQRWYGQSVALNMPANLETQQWPQDWEGQFSFQSQRRPMPKNVQITIQLHSFYMTARIKLKILQARLQQDRNRELPRVQAGIRKLRGTRDQIANICWIIEKAREFQANIYFCFIEYAKTFDSVDYNKLWEILNEREHQTALPASWETCTQVKKQQLDWRWNNRLVPNWERRPSRMYIVNLFI